MTFVSLFIRRFSAVAAADFELGIQRFQDRAYRRQRSRWSSLVFARRLAEPVGPIWRRPASSIDGRSRK